jgi:hypothetical protein
MWVEPDAIRNLIGLPSFKKKKRTKQKVLQVGRIGLGTAPEIL